MAMIIPRIKTINIITGNPPCFSSVWTSSKLAGAASLSDGVCQGGGASDNGLAGADGVKSGEATGA